MTHIHRIGRLLACLLLPCALLIAGLPAWAQPNSPVTEPGAPAPAPMAELAVLSAISDSFTITTYRKSVGSNTDRNLKEVMRLPEPAYDLVALRAVARAVGGRIPSEQIVFLSAASGADYGELGRHVDERRFELPPWLETALRKYPAKRLLLVTKALEDADISIYKQVIGSGRLEGLGYYVDRATRLRSVEGGGRGTDFVAPYAYLRATMVDLQTLQVLDHAPVRATQVVASYEMKGEGDLWDAFDNKEKVRILQELVETGVHEAAKRLLDHKGT